jgi:hypothetical protein
MKTFRCTLAVLLCVAACKGDTKYKDTPETLAKLDNCNRALTEKDKLIKDYEDRLAKYDRDKAQPNEILVAIEGDAVVIKQRTGGGGGAPPVDDKIAAALTQDFLGQVKRSKGAIQKCYEQALKKNTGLQASTITLKLSASFAAAGTFQKTSFNPSLGDTFDACLRNVATKWKLKPAPQAMTFQAQVALVPA